MNKFYQYLIALLLPLIIFSGFYYPIFGYTILACMFLSLIIAYFNGRYWCGFMCPRGLFFDIFLRKISKKNRVPSLFKHISFRIAWIMILMSVMTFQFIKSGGDIYLFGKGLLMILTVTTAIGILFGLYYNERIWCMFCPIGTMSSWIGKNKNSIKIDDLSCENCNLCQKNCPMGIYAGDYRKFKKVNNGDCIKCEKCIMVCPKNALNL